MEKEEEEPSDGYIMGLVERKNLDVGKSTKEIKAILENPPDATHRNISTKNKQK